VDLVAVAADLAAAVEAVAVVVALAVDAAVVVVAVAEAVVVADAAAVGAIAVHATNVKALENFKRQTFGSAFFRTREKPRNRHQASRLFPC
jgi:3-dehydroquinate dehydratase